MPIVVNMVQDPWHMLPGMPLGTCNMGGYGCKTWQGAKKKGQRADWGEKIAAVLVYSW